jgi:hypothetical protein
MTTMQPYRDEAGECLAELCQRVLRVAGPTVAAEVDAVVTGLSEPLRVAVVGRVKAGKSTLVNALVGQRVAPTRATECTQYVTAYRFGRPAQAVMVLRDGRRRPLRLDDGRLPDDTGADPSQVDHIDVQLPTGRLRDLVLIDTPGLGTTSTALVDATRRAVVGTDASSRSATKQADALLFLFREVEHQDEVEFLSQFRAASGAMATAPTNAVGLLAHADGFGTNDPFAAARQQAERLSNQRTREVSTVLPISGLLAETARTGRITEEHARLLASLADVSTEELRLWSVTGPPHGVDPDALDALVDRLGPYGLGAGRLRAGQGAGRLIQWLEDVSGVQRLEQVIRDQLLARTGPLKAEQALTALESLAQTMSGAAREEVLDLLAEARMDERLHPAREVRALGVLAAHGSGNTALPAELERLVSHRANARQLGLPVEEGPAAVAREARRRAAAAQALVATAPTSAETEAARVVSRSWLLAARRHHEPDAPPAASYSERPDRRRET